MISYAECASTLPIAQGHLALPAAPAHHSPGSPGRTHLEATEIEHRTFLDIPFTRPVPQVTRPDFRFRSPSVKPLLREVRTDHSRSVQTRSVVPTARSRLKAAVPGGESRRPGPIAERGGPGPAIEGGTTQNTFRLIRMWMWMDGMVLGKTIWCEDTKELVLGSC